MKITGRLIKLVRQRLSSLRHLIGTWEVFDGYGTSSILVRGIVGDSSDRASHVVYSHLGGAGTINGHDGGFPDMPRLM